MAALEFIFAIIISVIVSLFTALLVWWIFSVIDVEALDALSYWQVYGITVAVGIMTSKANTE